MGKSRIPMWWYWTRSWHTRHAGSSGKTFGPFLDPMWCWRRDAWVKRWVGRRSRHSLIQKSYYIAYEFLIITTLELILGNRRQGSRTMALTSGIATVEWVDWYQHSSFDLGYRRSDRSSYMYKTWYLEQSTNQKSGSLSYLIIESSPVVRRTLHSSSLASFSWLVLRRQHLSSHQMDITNPHLYQMPRFWGIPQFQRMALGGRYPLPVRRRRGDKENTRGGREICVAIYRTWGQYGSNMYLESGKWRLISSCRVP